MEIYQPSDDSLLFADFLKKYFKAYKQYDIKCLDMGTGSGILAKTISKFVSPENVIALDINPAAVKALKEEKFEIIESDLFERLKGEKFDVIVFNAPYLPLDEREPEGSRVATTGGERGDEVALEFLRQAREHLNEGGRVFLLVSSLTPLDRIGKVWDYAIVARKKVFMEELLILEFGG